MQFALIILLIFALRIELRYCDETEKSVCTSIASMEELLKTETLLIDTLESYAEELQWKLDTIRSGIAKMRAENQKSQTNAEKYLSNPLNSFSLIRRLHEDWIGWELFMANSVGEDQVKVIQKHRTDMPTENDLNEAAVAIHRLQRTYGLSAADMAAGKLNGKQYDAKLSWQDCFTIGFHLVKLEESYDAGFWLYNALQAYEKSEIITSLKYSKLHIMELYANVLLEQNRTRDALQVIEAALVENPNNSRLLNKRDDLQFLSATVTDKPKSNSPTEIRVYEFGCRGGFSSGNPRLHCRYNSTVSAFLKLAPLKMEEVELEPYIVLYHDVISDAEIAVLKEMAKPQLERATTFSYDEKLKKRNIVNQKRTSKFAWFSDNTNNVTIRLNRRIVDMTGFDLEDSEKLQVMNYGLGGHYDDHYDFFNASIAEAREVVRLQGDRMATVLFYVGSFRLTLSDVEDGGATVFTNLNLAVLPRKGTAVMWYNLNNRGEGDWRTMHAACPVIVGSKWVCNKWIRERNQIFRRPCYN